MSNENTGNPFKPGPVPRPLRWTDMTAPEIFTSEVLSEHIRINHGWLAAKSRSTRQIVDALFPHFEMGGMTRAEVFEQLNAALWASGFRQDEVKENPFWCLPKEAKIPKDKLGDLWKGGAADDCQA